MIIFVWKICINCLPVRYELHKRMPDISPLCHFYNEANETIEHLFLLCPLAKATWFGMDLALRIDELCINTLKDWIIEWLNKIAFLKPEAFWLYGQFVSTL